MAFTVHIVGYTVEEDATLPARVLDMPLLRFSTAEEAYEAGNAEIMRMAAAGEMATFQVLNSRGRPVDHEGRRPGSWMVKEGN